MALNDSTEAARFLDYYLSDDVPAEYAVMLSAPWGAGKTHFIRKYMDERASRLSREIKSCYLYASLYGVSSVSTVNEQFFSQLYPSVNKTLLHVAGTTAAHWIDKFAGSKSREKLAREMLLNLKGRVLIFDDLERCSMKITDVLGFINTFVEHERLKVIILANESDVPEAQRNDYLRQKEKLVGKTIEVKSDQEEVLQSLIDRLKTVPVRELVEREKSAVLSTFAASGKSNFRNLRATLAEFERLVDAIGARLTEKPSALKELLLYVLATGLEFRGAELTEETLRSLPTSSFAFAKVLSSTPKSSAEELFDSLSSKYPLVKWTDPIIAPRRLAELYGAGIINIGEINSGLDQHPAVVGAKNTPAWRVLWNWTQLTRAEYQAARAELADELAERKIPYPGLILHVASTAITLAEYGDHILGDGVEPKEFVERYLAEMLAQGALVPNVGSYGFDMMACAGLGFSAFQNPKFTEIFAIVKQAAEEANRRCMAEVARGYVKDLESSNDRYSSLFEYGVLNGNYGGMPFLHHVPVADFARLLVSDSRPNDRLFASLVARYDHDVQRGCQLRDEYQWIAELESHLLVMVDQETAPFEQLLRKRIDHNFNRIKVEIGQSPVATA